MVAYRGDEVNSIQTISVAILPLLRVIMGEVDPSQRIVVSGVEPVREGKGHWEEVARENPRKLLLAVFCAFLKQLLGDVVDRVGRSSGFVSTSGLAECLYHCKALISDLMSEDRSRDISFVERFVDVWESLLESYHLLASVRKEMRAMLTHIDQLIQEISHYPSGADHSLGWYMTQKAGREWLPHPLMDLLQQLYQNHLQRKEESILSVWVGVIDRGLLELEGLRSP